jgi:hypothetical protein
VSAPPVVRVLHHPKSSHAEVEWEDAAAYSERRGVAAVADGAATSYRAARWSAALVESFVAGEVSMTPAGFSAWVTGLGERFQDRSVDVSDTASWYASDASRRGSFATFCGLRLDPSGGPGYSAVHVGDACLFHTRGDRLVAATMDDPSAFDAMPELLSSADYDGSRGAERARFSSGEVAPGDILFLTTDALGAAMLRLARAGQSVWRFFGAVGQEGFRSVVEALRDATVMEDDDVTLMRIRVRGAPS